MDRSVTIILLNSQDPLPLTNRKILHLLRKKLSTNNQPCIPFKYNFTLKGTLGNATTFDSCSTNVNGIDFSFPRDVKISYRHSLIVVSDFGNSRIVLFDLMTRKFVTSIPLSFHPQCLAFDTNDMDSLIVTLSYCHVCKFRIFNRGEPIVRKWQVGISNNMIHENDEENRTTPNNLPPFTNNSSKTPKFYYPMGVAVIPKRNYESSDIYICNSGYNQIEILNSFDGSLIRSISTLVHHRLEIHSQIHEPWSIAVLFSNKMNPKIVISEYWNSKIKILSPAINNSDANQHYWDIKKSISILGNDEEYTSMPENDHNMNSQQGTAVSSNQPDYFVCPMGLCVDRSTGNIIVSDSMNHRIMVFHKSGKFLKSFGSFGIFNKSEKLYAPFGMCVNERTGELFVVDENNHRILMFD
ncbi:hypothetical protein C9374_013544 [Naegleria lovaniensis]|uniref:NHL repeat-containing protein n=1 Tax=Naegleria lovaniensis TaxID=51637 RepID=A0AA88H1N6_NAELO|nr:uncharacterized protein C9374_013544 [Naegleria lovaniensis]KAG2392059.1 hypothetical protein C9374_013544 [Naegleria lovaniensis]